MRGLYDYRKFNQFNTANVWDEIRKTVSYSARKELVKWSGLISKREF